MSGVQMSDPNWMEGIHKGGLHRTLGIPQGQDIPAKKIKQAADSSNPLERKEGVLAETFKRYAPK